MKNLIAPAICALLIILLPVTRMQAQQTGKKAIYQLSVYHFKNSDQESRIDNYLQYALLPALHRTGHGTVGVFKPLANDTAADKTIYVLVTHPSINHALDLKQRLNKDREYPASAAAFETAAYDNPPFVRVENILMEAFRFARQPSKPQLSGNRTDHIFELRSYESATEKLYQSKVHMFNEGGEITLFKRLGFNAVFYGEVIAGSRMPNFWYMTSFNSLEDRNEHWKTFGNDPEWKAMLAKPEYKNNVSRSDIILARSTAYSDL